MSTHLPPCADPSTLEAIPAAICWLDARDLRVIAHNRLYQSLLAEPYRTAGVVGLRVEEYLPGVAELGLLDCHRQLTRTGEPCIVRPCIAREFPYRGFPRGPTYWDVHIAPTRNHQGEVAWQLLTVWDVTERVLAQQRLRAALGRERFLNETVRAFTEAADVDTALRRVADSAVVTVADGCVVQLTQDGALTAVALRHRDPAKEEAWRSGLAGARIPFGEGIAGRVAASGQPELIRDVHPEDTAPRFRPLAFQLQAGSILAVPIRRQEGVLGVLLMVRERQSEPFGDEDLAFAATIADRLALAIANLHLLEGLHHQLSFTHAITSSLGEGVFALDRQGRVTLLNPAAEQMLGWTEAELLAKDMHAVIHFQRADGTPFAATECPLLEVMRSGTTVCIDDVFTRKDGTMFPVTCTSSPIVTDGQTVGVVLTFRDIAERKQHEQERERLLAEQRRQRELLEKLVEKERRLRSAADLLLVVTEAALAATDLCALLAGVLEHTVAAFGARAGAVLLLDERGERLVVRKMVGVPQQAAFTVRVGEGFAGRIAAEGRPLAVGDVQREGWMVSPDLKAQGIRAMLGVPLVCRGETLGVLHVDFQEERGFAEEEIRLLQAVAERIALLIANARLRAEAERRAQQLAEFTRLIAHDVCQPLTIARGHAQLLRSALERGDRQRARSSADALDVATRRLEAMIQDLVESARLEAGQLPLDREPVELIAFVSDLLRRLAEVLDVSRVRVEGTAPVVAYADQNRLERIVGNLLSNALKYSDLGTQITVRVDERAGEGLVSVSDRGPGIAPEALPHLFERGFRTPGAARKAEGAGLGLHIVRLLVEAHGGCIGAESTPGQGSTFHFTLPLAALTRGEKG